MSIKTNNLLGLSNKNIGMARPYVPIPSSPWVRDPNWPALPSVSGLQKFSGLAAIFNSTNNWISFEITVTGTISYTVDWGDGTSNTYTTSGVQFKNISYAGISASPITHSGQTYKPCIITVTVNTGNMTFFNLQSNSWTNALGNTATFLTGTSTSWLDIAIEGQYITTLTISNSAGSMRHYLLESCYIGNMPLVTSFQNLFYWCVSLRNVSILNSINVTNMISMFVNCYSLTTVSLFNTQNVTDMGSMFNLCYSLTTVPLFNTQNVTVMTTMFNACNKLESVPLFNTIACNSMNNMLSGCSSIKSIPLFNMPAATTAFSCSNTAISSVPALSYANNTGSLTFTNNGALSQFLATGISRSLNVGSCNLFKDSLELIFTNLNTAAVASQIITITSNPGADTAVSKTMVTDSTLLTHTMADTSGLVVGMTASGTGMPITSGSGVSFIDAGDLVDLGSTSYQIPNNTEVSVSVLITTTGITLNRIYYVVNSTPRYFQLSLTQGGAAIALTTNGSGTIKYRSKIVSIVPNVSVTLDTQVGTTGSKSVTFRMLDTSRAIMKNYSITG